MIQRQHASLDWGDKPFKPETEQDILSARIEHEGALILQLMDDSALYGQFTRLEDFIRTNGLSMHRQTNCEAGYDGERVEPVTNAFNLSVVATKLATAIKHLEAERFPQGLTAVRQAKSLLLKSLPPEMGKLQSLEFE